jgi:hypothetical protein
MKMIRKRCDIPVRACQRVGLSSHAGIDADEITRFGDTGLMVPAIKVWSPAALRVRANSLASSSLLKVFVARCGRSSNMLPLAM